MASPITWKNINTPSFGASNALLSSATKQMSDAFSGLSNRLIDQGEYNEKQNTDALKATMAQYQDYDAFKAAQPGLLQGLGNQNIDESAIVDFAQNKQRNLGVDETQGIERNDRKAAAAIFAALNQGRQDGTLKGEGDALDFAYKEAAKLGASPETTMKMLSDVRAMSAPTREQEAQAAAAALTAKNAFTAKESALDRTSKENVARAKKKGSDSYKFTKVANRDTIAPFFEKDPTDGDKRDLDKFAAQLQNKDGQFIDADGIPRVANADQLEAAILAALSDNPTYGFFGDDTDIDEEDVIKFLGQIVKDAPLKTNPNTDSAANLTPEELTAQAAEALKAANNAK